MPNLTMALSIIGVLGLTALGCGGNNRRVQHAVVAQRAPFDFQCPAQSLVITHMGGDLWAVQGCGQRAVYNTNGLCSAMDNCDPALESRPTREAAGPTER